MDLTDNPAQFAAAIADRYQLGTLLGRGGMASVYLAQDLKHHRAVAIKVLRPDFAASLGSERFLKEIEIVARLSHPHILPLHDSGRVDDFLYYVMPLVDGGSLRQRLVHSPQLSVSEALAILTPIANALTYSHRMQLLHRDIKPENILFLQGHPVVADFGIARAVRNAGAENLTRTGLALGTPGYMSPEQAFGARDLTEASDVYSLAAVFYEMIVGEVPAAWPSDDEVHAGRFLRPPDSHRARLSNAGARVEAALLRAMAINPDRRTPTPEALIEDLRGTTVGVARRGYDPDEVDAIVKRAAELEAARPGPTMTIGGIERVADEVGIAPEFVRSAERSLRIRPYSTAVAEGEKPSKLLGGPKALRFERVVIGELPDSDFSAVVEELRRRFQQVGQVSQLGRSFSWTLTKRGGGKRDMEIAVTVRSGETRIVLQESLYELRTSIFGGICGGVGAAGLMPIVAISTTVLSAGGALAAIVPAWFAAMYGVARASYGHYSGRRAAELQAAADALAELVGELVRDNADRR